MPAWPLVAWCERAGDFCCFLLDRIRDLAQTAASFLDEPGKRLADFKRLKGEKAMRTALG